MNYYTVKKFYANDTIFREGSLGHVAYILKEGTVEISAEPEGRKAVLGVLRPVTVFGEMALLAKDHRRSGTATALEYSELVEISRESFENFVESTPTFIRMILTTLAERLGDANTRIVHTPDPFAALCQVLDLLAQGGKPIRRERILAALSGALSVDPQAIEAQLLRLEQVGLITTGLSVNGVSLVRIPGESFLKRALAVRDALPPDSPGEGP